MAIIYCPNHPWVVHGKASELNLNTEWFVAMNWESLQMLNDNFKNHKSSPVGDGKK